MRPWFLALMPLLALPACDPVDTYDAETLYDENCAICHGPGGQGDGPAAGGLTPPPADLTRLAARNGGVFPLTRTMSYIDGYKLPERAMPQFGDLLQDAPSTLVETDDGVLTPTPVPLIALANYLESLQVSDD